MPFEGVSNPFASFPTCGAATMASTTPAPPFRGLTCFEPVSRLASQPARSWAALSGLESCAPVSKAVVCKHRHMVSKESPERGCTMPARLPQLQNTTCTQFCNIVQLLEWWK